MFSWLMAFIGWCIRGCQSGLFGSDASTAARTEAAAQMTLESSYSIWSLHELPYHGRLHGALIAALDWAWGRPVCAVLPVARSQMQIDQHNQILNSPAFESEIPRRAGVDFSGPLPVRCRPH